MNFHKLRTLVGLLLVAFLLTSCKADSTETSVAEENPVQGSNSSADEVSEVGEPNPAQGPDSSADEGSQAGEPQPEPRTELSATNPGSVNLGSGRVTLVEFFAFW